MPCGSVLPRGYGAAFAQTFSRAVQAAERDDVWERDYRGRRERDRLLLRAVLPTPACVAARCSATSTSIDSTQRYRRITGQELRGAVKRLRRAG